MDMVMDRMFGGLGSAFSDRSDPGFLPLPMLRYRLAENPLFGAQRDGRRLVQIGQNVRLFRPLLSVPKKHE